MVSPLSNMWIRTEHILAKVKRKPCVCLKFATVNPWFRILALTNPRSMVSCMRPNDQLKKTWPILCNYNTQSPTNLRDSLLLVSCWQYLGHPGWNHLSILSLRCVMYNIIYTEWSRNSCTFFKSKKCSKFSLVLNFI